MSADRRPLRVLVVDDCPDTRSSYQRLLEYWGFAVLLVADGEAALAAEEELRPDAVLLDVGLPGISGWDVARRVWERCGDGRPFIICITGWGDDRTRTRAAADHCDVFLVKPVDPDEIRLLLNRVAARP